MKFVLILCVFIALTTVQASPGQPEKKSTPLGSLEEEWASFKTKYNKAYKNDEDEQYRKGIFAKNLKRIQEHNRKYDAGEVSFKQGVNNLADLTANEFRSGFLGLKKHRASHRVTHM